MDTTDTLREIIRQDLDDVVFFGIYDPDAVEQAVRAGVGATVTLSIGAKLPMPQLPVASAPLTVTGVVQTISSGSFRLKGGLTPGLQVYMGRSVVLDTGKVLYQWNGKKSSGIEKVKAAEYAHGIEADRAGDVNVETFGNFLFAMFLSRVTKQMDKKYQ